LGTHGDTGPLPQGSGEEETPCRESGEADPFRMGRASRTPFAGVGRVGPLSQGSGEAELLRGLPLGLSFLGSAPIAVFPRLSPQGLISDGRIKGTGYFYPEGRPFSQQAFSQEMRTVCASRYSGGCVQEHPLGVAPEPLSESEIHSEGSACVRRM